MQWLEVVVNFLKVLVESLLAPLVTFIVAREREKRKQAEQELSAVEKANEVENRVNRMSDAAIADELQKSWVRDVDAHPDK
jgi:hypothetical protein